MKRSGSALVMVLGVLVLLALLVLSFTLASRTERFAARHGRDRAAARQQLDVALSAAMEDLRELLINGSATQPFAYEGVISANCLASRGPDSNRVVNQIFEGFATNLVPAVLWDEARSMRPVWKPIIGIDEESNLETGTNGLVAYLIVNGSGFLDVGAISSNQAAALQADGVDISDGDRFLADRARDAAIGFDLPPYLTLRELHARNRGVLPPVSNLFAVSYDPGPDVTLTNDNILGRREVRLAPKFDVNSWTNGLGGSDLSDSSDLSDIYQSPEFRHGWLPAVSNRLATIGFDAPAAIAWNLINFMDGDRVPQSDAARPWQHGWPVEDVPLINELAVAMVPTNWVEGGHANHYAPAVEVWYPFVPGRITEADDAWLVLAVYTNWTGSRTADDIMRPAAGEGLLCSNRLARMEYGGDSEYVVATLPAPYIAFPVTVSNALTGALETRYLPLGEVVCDVFDPATGRVETRTLHNEIRLQARVALGEAWVDEAMVFDPADPDPARAAPLLFTNVCGYTIDDPRQNDAAAAWMRYTAETTGAAAAGGTAYACSLSGTTNANCRPWFAPYGQGVPMVHLNQSLTTAGELGYVATTSRWESIGLADPRLLGTNGAGYAFTAGSVLEFFTARATNTPVRGRVHFSTPWTNVVRTLLADIPIGWPGRTAYLDDEARDWMTGVFFDAQRLLYDNCVPVGVGDMCGGIGNVRDYVDGGDTNSTGSLGSDLKEDILRGLAERISFRQQIFVILLAGQTLTPNGRVSAEQRAAVVVLRDAYTGRWRIHSWAWDEE